MHYASPAGQKLLQHETGIGRADSVRPGLKRIRLLTNHPRKVVGLEGFGIEIAGTVAGWVNAWSQCGRASGRSG